jgi:glucuronoarabinoxylan endo-1,4-beta-xylanase
MKHTIIARSGILRIVFLLFFGIAISCSKKETGGGDSPPVIIPEAEVTINTAENNQLIRGFGCATVFAPPNTSPLTSEEFDRIFGSGNGQVGLNFLRIRVASDDAWRATELANAKAAIQRGAKVFATPWSPPARMKTNNNIIKGKLIPDSAANYAKYLNDFAGYMAANGAPLYAISVQNEPDWEPDYESCVWTATEMRDFLKNQGALITATKLIAPELVNNNQTYVNTILSDNAAVANLDILGTHLYGGGIVENQLAKSNNLEVWMTEHLDTATTNIANLNTAVEIHDCFTKANFNAYIWWYGKRFYGIVGQDGAVTKRGYYISQFSRFIKEGAIRLGTSTNSRSDILISAYRNGTKKVIIAINTGPGEVKQKFILKDGTAATVVPYVTTFLKNVEQEASITLSNNSFSFTMPVGSVVTFVEQ